MIDQAGTVLLSKRVENDEEALLIELLAAHGQQLLYVPGRIVHHAAATYRGDGTTNAKDARIIADQARMRGGLLRVDQKTHSVPVPDQLACNDDGGRQVPAGVERCEEEVRHWSLLASGMHIRWAEA